MKHNIGFRLNALFVLLVTVLLTCSGAIAWWTTRGQLLQQYQLTRAALQQRMQISLISSVWNLDIDTLRESLSAELKPPVRGIAVYDNGRLLASIGQLSVAREDAAYADTLEFPLIDRRSGSAQLLGHVRALLSREGVDRELRAQVWRRSLEIVALDVALVAALSLGLRLLVLRPLAALKDALATAAEHRGPSEALMLPADRQDEFGDVVRSFNQIAQRLGDDLEHVRHAEAETRRAYEHLKQTQASLVQAEKLAALGGLVAGVAHEINTPLGITLTGASVLAEETRQLCERVNDGNVKKSEVQAFLKTAGESVDLILSNAQRAAHLVQSFKQVAVDQTSEARRDFDLAHYLDEVIESLRPTYKRRPIQVTNACAAEIHMDSYPGALAQVATNLLVNAVTHAFPDGRAGQISVSGRRDGEWVTLVFEDDGQGIPQAYLPRIFEPFFTTRRGSGGSGLGLHMVYNIVTKRLGGEIGVNSTVGQGTRFTLRFPAVAPYPQEGPAS